MGTDAKGTNGAREGRQELRQGKPHEEMKIRDKRKSRNESTHNAIYKHNSPQIALLVNNTVGLLKLAHNTRPLSIYACANSGCASVQRLISPVAWEGD